jgi:hypothetical protein
MRSVLPTVKAQRSLYSRRGIPENALCKVQEGTQNGSDWVLTITFHARSVFVILFLNG